MTVEKSQSQINNKKRVIVLAFFVLFFIIVFYYVLFIKPPFRLAGRVIQELRDTCEIDRSCCQNVGLNYVCFRTSEYINGTLPPQVTQEYLALEYPSSQSVAWGIGENYLSYFGSRWFLQSHGAISGGIDKVFMKESVGGYFMQPLFFAGTSGKYQWSPALRKFYVQDWSKGFYSEGETGFLNTESIMWMGRIINLRDGNNTAGFQGNLATYIDSYSITYRDDIDGTYSGFEIHTTEACTAACDDTFNIQFLIVINETPSSYEINGRNYALNFEFPERNNNMSFTVLWTNKQFESNVSDWLNNPNYYFQSTKQQIDSWIQKFPNPQYISGNDYLLRAYYRNIIGFWLSSFSIPFWDDNSPSYLSSYTVFPPSPTRYYGVWTSDTARMILALMEATDDPEITNLCKNQVNVFVENMYNGHFRSDIRDSAMGTGLQSPLLQMAAWKIYENDGDKVWLNEIYDEMVSDLEYRYNNRRDSNGLYYCGGLECGDGRDNSVAIDINSEMYLAWKALAYMAYELNKIEDYNTFLERSDFITGNIHHFWNENENYLFDLNKDSLTQRTVPYEHGNAFAWGFMWAGVPEAISNQDYITGMKSAITDTNRFNVDVLIPDIPKNDDDFSPGCSLWWCGNSWSNLAWRAAIGLKNSGETNLANQIRLNTLNNIAYFPFGYENYLPTTEGSVPGGSGYLYGWTMAHFVHLANTNEFLFIPPDVTLSVKIITPSDNQRIYSDALNITYSSIGATSYSVYGDSNVVCSSTQQTSCLWQGFSEGTHTIRVTATNGQETKETSVTFTYEPVDIEITHPNLLFSKEDLPSIKNNVQTGPYSNKYNALISRVNSMSDWNPSSTIGSVIWSKGFYAMELGLAYQLTNNAAYAAKGKNYLLGFAGFTPAQYASQDVHAVSDTFWQLSLAYDFLYETMTEQERQTVVNFLYDSCVANDLLENYYTEYGSHNGAGMNQGIGICALAIYGEHPADPFFNLTTDYFSRIYNATNNYLGGFFNSAYALDGISYQDYGLRHTLSFIQAYDRRFPEDSFLNRYSTTLCGIPEYYTFSIWDTDSPYNNEYIRRMDISDIQHAYYPIEPEIMSFLANKCNNPAMQWLLLFQNNNSAWSSAYNSIQTAEDLVYFDKGLTPVHPSNYYGLSWRDGHNDLTIWRDGWTLTNDLVVTFKSDDENGGHPHADDNSLLIFYKEELLTDNGYRNGTNEIPAGENYHNTLVVDEKGEMRWSDLGSSAPVGTRQLFGYTGDLLPGDCAWPNCYYQPITFRGYFAQYDITDEYRAVQGRKPYYTLQDYTRYVVLLNTSPPVIIMKDQITSASEHDYDINFVIPYEDITEQDTDTLLVQNNNANLLIKTIYTTSDYYHRLKYRKYGKQYRDGSFKYEYITSNSVRINNTYNLTIIHAIIPYLDSEPVPYLFTYEESPVSITVYIYAQDKNWSVTFDKADVQEVMVLSGSEVSPPDPRFPKMDNFDGSTSELADADQLSSYENFVLEKTQYGKIEWLEPVDLTYLNIDSNVFINHKSIALRSLPALNKSANLYFYNINYRSPLVYRNSQICTDCAILEYSSNTLKTGVPHFTNYSIGTSARLEIEDDTDSETKYINESVTFYADYYNISNGNLISNADCNLTVDSNTYDMALHSEYELDLIFDDDGTYTWRVVCTSADFDSLNATDTVVIHDLEEEDTCGDDICEPEDDFCPADCNTKSHCGDYNTICLAGQACIDSVCQNIGEESSGGGGSSGGGSGLSGFLTKIENDTVGEQEESVEHGVITEELKQQQEQYLEQPDATEYNDEKARKQLVDSIKIITARMQGIIAFIVITWVSLIVLLYLSSQGQLTNVPVLRNIPKIKMLEPQKKHGLVTMLNLVETNKIMSKAHLQKLMNINDEEFNRMLKFLESKKIIGIDNEKIIYKENK